jgi:hypothetical protein
MSANRLTGNGEIDEQQKQLPHNKLRARVRANVMPPRV